MDCGVLSSNGAAANDACVVQWFKDVLPSETPLDKRPGMLALMASLLGNGVTAVVIEKLDRLARDTVISELTVAYFQRNNFQLISTLSLT
jgi:DNA invertase Pin-like site-specific DNA recombinase